MAKFKRSGETVDSVTSDGDGSMSVDNTTEELIKTLDNFEERKNRPETVEHLLPNHAHVRDGELEARNIATSDKEIAYLTDKRKRILKEAKRNPERTQVEISKAVNTSDTHVSRTLQTFGFLIEDDRLYEAFMKPKYRDRWHTEKWGVRCEEDECELKHELHPTQEEARERAETHAVVWGHYPTVLDPDEKTVPLSGVLDLVTNEEDWSMNAVEGVRIAEEEFGSIPSLFERIAHGEFSGERDEETEQLRSLDEDTYVEILKILFSADTEKADSIAQEIVETIY